MSIWPGWETPWDGAGLVVANETMAEGIARAVRRLVAHASGMDPKDVHPVGDGGPRGSASGASAGVFATVQITETHDASWSESAIDDAGTGETIRVPIYFTAMVNFYRGKPSAAPKDGAGLRTFTTAAYDQAARLPKRMQLTAYQEERRLMGLGFIGASAARDLSDLIDAQWESRGQIDLHFSAVASEAAAITTFAVLGDVVIKAESPDGTVATVTIP